MQTESLEKTKNMIKIIVSPISKKELRGFAHVTFVSLVKAAVDVENRIMALGGDLHADEEMALIENGSKQKDLWGINIYYDKPKNDWIEFDSMINIRPKQGNRSRDVDNEEVREKIKEIVNELTE